MTSITPEEQERLDAEALDRAIAYSKAELDYLVDDAYDDKVKIVDTPAIEVDGETLYVHGGMDRNTGLLQMVEHVNEAGEPLPFIRMRDDESQPVMVYTQSKIRKILAAISARKNRFESAHNRVFEKLAKLEKKRDDPTNSIAERRKASEDAVELMQNYPENLKAEAKKYDPSALPTDIDELRAVLLERIEAAGMRRVKYFKGVLTQQGVDLPDSCDDQANATRAVAAAVDAGNEALVEAEAAEAMELAYNATINAINRIEPLNVPEFKIAGDALGANPLPQTVAGNSFTFRADHPGGSGIPGNVRVPRGRVRGFDGETEIDLSYVNYVRQDDETMGGGTVSVSASQYAGKMIRVEIEARNRCGPSVLTIVMAVPEATP